MQTEYRGNYSTHIEMIHTRLLAKHRTYAKVNALIAEGLLNARKGAKIKRK